MITWKQIFVILRRKDVSEKTKQKYIAQSSRYHQCATGELKNALETVGYTFNDRCIPNDKAVKRLSIAFNAALLNNKIDEAETIYNALKVLSYK